MTIGLSHLLLAGGLAACLCGIGGFAYGTHVGAAREQAAQRRADAAAAKVRAELQGAIDASAQRQQAAEYTRQADVRTIYHESEKIIDRPVYRNVCIDSAGVRLLDAAAAVANGARLGEPSGAAAAAAESPAQ